MVKGTQFSERGVFCEKWIFLKENFPKLRHLTKKITAFQATFWACSDMCCSNFHAGNRNKRDAGFLLRIFYFFNLYFFLGTQQQTLLTSCWRRPQVTPNSREPAGISPALHLV
jgi:hypothetical protein